MTLAARGCAWAPAAAVVVALGAVLVMPCAVADAAPTAITIIVDRTDAQSLGARVRTAMQSYFERDPRVTVRVTDVGLEASTPFGPAAEAASKAAKSFREMELDTAKEEVEKAIAVYEQHIEALAALETGLRPLRDAHILLAKIRFFESSFDGAKDALRRAFVLDPKLVYSSQLFPPQMRRVVVEARLLFDTMHSGRVVVTSEPTGAEITLNGKPTGLHTPATIEAPAGPNVIHGHMPGYQIVKQAAEVGDGRGDAKVSLTLPRANGDDRMREITANLAAGQTNKTDLDAIAQGLSSDALVLVHIGAASDMRFRLTGGLFVRPHMPAPDPKKKKSKRAKPVTVSDEAKALIEPRLERGGVTPTLEGECENMARSLAEHLQDRVGQPPAVAQTHADEDEGEGKWHRFRHSKAFWWVVGGVAGVVVVGAAVGLGVGLSERRQEIGRETVLLGGH